MALALPIAHQLHASAGITALGVMLTGTQAFLELLTQLLTEVLTHTLTHLLTPDSQTQAFVHERTDTMRSFFAQQVHLRVLNCAIDCPKFMNI